MESRRWQGPLVAVRRSSSLLLPRAWKFTKRLSRRTVSTLPVPVSKLPATLRQRENSARRRWLFTRSFYRRAKALKILSRGWKISGISQSKLDAFDRLQAGTKFRARVSSIRRICQQEICPLVDFLSVRQPSNSNVKNKDVIARRANEKRCRYSTHI